MRDVTREAFLESANGEVAVAGRAGLITAVRRGEAPILARFEGSYASTTMTVMGDRSGFVWTDPPTFSKIDELVAAKWKRLKILPSGLSNDTDFIRRVYLDLIGLPPSADDVRTFLADKRDSSRQTRRIDRSPDRQPRFRRLLDQQVGRPSPGQSKIPWRRGIGGFSQLDPRPGCGKSTVRQVRQDHPHREWLEPRKPSRCLFQDPARPCGHHGKHHAALPGRPVQLQQMPRSSVRTLDPGSVLPDCCLLCAGRI